MITYENWERYLDDLDRLEILIEGIQYKHENIMSKRMADALEETLSAIMDEKDVATVQRDDLIG